MKLFLLLAMAMGVTAFAQEPQARPIHDQHQAAVNQRGDHAMGFSHEKSTHHFRLLKDGGAIEVDANDAKDEASQDQIRGHLAHIAKMFSDGNFQAPMFIHDQTPPGVPLMKERKNQIAYRFEPTQNGGRVRMSTKDKEALDAVHQFLRFQISDHHTGESTSVSVE